MEFEPEKPAAPDPRLIGPSGRGLSSIEFTRPDLDVSEARVVQLSSGHAEWAEGSSRPTCRRRSSQSGNARRCAEHLLPAR